MTRKLVVAALAVLLPGCALVVGPVGAIKGRPFAATQLDAMLVGGRTGPIFYGHSNGDTKIGAGLRLAALLELPLALSVDTALLPLALATGIPRMLARAPEVEPRADTRPPSSPKDPEPSAPDSAEPVDWAHTALFDHGIRRHPALRELCGMVPALSVLPWRRSEDRVQVLALGWRGSLTLIRLQRWPTRERCWASVGLRTAQSGDGYVSACTWNAEGERIDLFLGVFDDDDEDE